MTSRMIVLVLLAGAMVLMAGMLGGCKKQEPAPAVPAAPAGPNAVSKDMQKAASDLAVKTEAVATTAADAVKTTEKAQTAADQTAKMATDAAAKASDTTKAAVDTAKATAVVASAAVAEQTMCPVMEAPIDKSIFVEYKGKKVYFCCASCKSDFEKDPEKYIAKLPQFK